jgi:chromosome segregation ATPase
VISIDQSKEIQSDLANNFLNAIYVIESSGNTLQRSNSESNEALKEAVTAMQSLQKRGMTWLSMRAKTDTKLTELNEQLQSTLTQYAIIADRIATSADTSFSSYTEQIGELSRASQSLQEKVIQQELGLKEVKDGLSRIASIEQKLEISGGNEETK